MRPDKNRIYDRKPVVYDEESGEYIKLPSDRTFSVVMLYAGYSANYPDEKRPEIIEKLSAETGMAYKTIENELPLWNRTIGRIGASATTWRQMAAGLLPGAMANIQRAVETDTPRGTGASIAVLRGLHVFTDKAEPEGQLDGETTVDLVKTVLDLIAETPALKHEALKRLTGEPGTTPEATQPEPEPEPVDTPDETIPEPVNKAEPVYDDDDWRSIGRGVAHDRSANTDTPHPPDSDSDDT